ncbi:MAG: 3'(2'),5'-bisphosphate nucleotidase CysQ [Allosphingosinicella sp.]|uniref:3'(2'),5'-bisphosphate nucleotidase CysQ n=1 Tax=Allosphingosinicella sp. TaxID=2823234 RepID=UPI0039532A09
MSGSDAELAAETAEAAGRLLLDLRARGAPGAEADRAANDLILSRLRAARPDDGLLSEESPDGPARLGRRRVWIVDPLDGTREWVEGRDDWAVHVALVEGGVPTAGAVALPALGQLLRSDAPPPLPRPRHPPRILVSRTRPPAVAARLAEAVGAELVPMGSAGAKAMAVLLGAGDLYVHEGGQHEWDNCAPVAVALAAGLHAGRLDGTPIRYNAPVPFVPDLLVCTREAAPDLIAAAMRLRP